MVGNFRHRLVRSICYIYIYISPISDIVWIIVSQARMHNLRSGPSIDFLEFHKKTFNIFQHFSDHFNAPPEKVSCPGRTADEQEPV